MNEPPREISWGYRPRRSAPIFFDIAMLAAEPVGSIMDNPAAGALEDWPLTLRPRPEMTVPQI